MNKLQKILLVFLLTAIPLKGSAFSQGIFSAGPDFKEGLVDCQGFYDNGTECKELADTFAYSKDGIGWEAPKGTITDGASIPTWAQWLIGKPFDERFAPASILHDHYVRPPHQVRTYFQTQRMFYDALIDTGVDAIKAGTMYAAIVVGGDAWTKLAIGTKCKSVSNCVRTSSGLLDLPAQNRVPSAFDKLDMVSITRAFEKRIREERLTPEEIEAFARQQRLLLGIPTPIPVEILE